jgi:hypothetical protein
MDKTFKILRLPLFFLGLILFFAAERYLAAESYHLILRVLGLGLAGFGALCALIVASLTKQKGLIAESKSWMTVFLWQLAVFLSALGYLAYRQILGSNVTPDTALGKVVLALFLILMVIGFIAGFGIEFALRESGTGELAEPVRVRRAAGSWMAVAMLFIGLFGVNYAAAKKDVVSDWSYLKTTSPSPSTKALIKSLDKDLEVALFYPTTNEVRVQIQQYFDGLGAAESRIKINYFDTDLHPTAAEKFRVSRNGQVVLSMDGKRSRIDTGDEIKKARKSLAKLDEKFQKAFKEVTASKKFAYFTRGHGEASWVGSSKANPLRSLRTVEAVLRQQHYALKLFGIAEGSAEKIPDGASVVVVVGPTQPFSQPEVDALRKYLDRGGSLMVFLDREQKQEVQVETSEWPLRKLLAEVGIKYNDEMLANDREYVAATQSDRDKWFIHTNIFTSHDSVVSLSKHEERVALLAFEAGHFSLSKTAGDWKTSETVKTMSSTFVDLNKNYTFDKNEKRSGYVLGAVSQKKIGDKADTGAGDGIARVMVFGDATSLADAVIRNPGNVLFFVDSLKWAAGESEFAGEVASEEDIKIRHTRKEDVLWFNGTVFAMPLMVLGVGFFATRRKKRKST